MKLTVAQIRSLHAAAAEDSGADEALQARYYARPVSYWLAWILVRVGVTPNTTTVLALAASVLGCLFITFGSYTLGAVYLNIGHLLDYADGTMARATNTVTNFGRYFDRTCDEVVETIIPISVGIGLYISDCSFLGLPPLFYLMLGFSYAVTHLLSTLSILHSQLIYQAVPHRLYATSTSGLWRWLYTVGVNAKSSTVPALLLLTLIPNGLPMFLIGFAVLTFCELLLGFYTMVKSR